MPEEKDESIWSQENLHYRVEGLMSTKVCELLDLEEKITKTLESGKAPATISTHFLVQLKKEIVKDRKSAQGSWKMYHDLTRQWRIDQMEKKDK